MKKRSERKTKKAQATRQDRKKFIFTRIAISGLLLLAIGIGLAVYLAESRARAVLTLSSFNLREQATTASPLLGETKAGGIYRVKREVFGEQTVYGRRWYQIELDDGTEAYLANSENEEQRRLTQEDLDLAIALKLGRNEGLAPQDQTFAESLKAFPESYRDGLISLHLLYPAWQFEALTVEDSWTEVLAAEVSPEDKNLVQYEDTAYFQPYAWMVKNQTVYDGTNWYPANEEAISYHLDPRNFLNPRDVFQFLDLRNPGGRTDDSGVRQIFSGNEALLALVPEVLEAAKAVDMLPEALASRIYQEVSVGAGISLLAQGLLDPVNPPLVAGQASPTLLTKEEQMSQLETLEANGQISEAQRVILARLRSGGEGFPQATVRYYNLYNIGAYPDPSRISGAAMNGARFAAGLFHEGNPEGAGALGLPWTSQEVAVMGGALFIAEEYVAIGQNTAYLQKFDLISGTYNHQYMQALFSAVHEGRRFQAVLEESGRTGDALKFRIPVFEGMPETYGRVVD